MILIELEGCGRFIIYGCLELVFLCVIITIHLSPCETKKGQPIFYIVVRV